VAHVRAKIAPEETALVLRILSDGGAQLFESMPAADRRHGLDVADRLLRAGHDDPDLLGAALLHDAAKGHRMRLWHRVTGVLLEAAAPSLLRRLASPDPASPRHPFHLYLHHAPMSAELAAAAGCPPRLGAFIRGDAATDDDTRLLAALTRADDAS
jgi:hypothetical protein